MSKKKKTRHQKEVARLRHQIHITQISESGIPAYQLSSTPISTPEVKPEIPKSVVRTTNQRNYSYVLPDMRKTITITAVLFVANFILYFLIEKGIVHIIK